MLHENVEYLGIMTQEELSKITSEQADYILCMYDPIDFNNINASPNKIFDSIQLETPLIVNKEVLVSKFVKETRIGILVDSFYSHDNDMLLEELWSKKNKFIFDSSLKDKYSWENIEKKLIDLHK